MDYGCYNRNSWNISETDGCNVGLAVTYNISYGKKSERSEMDVNKNIDNAIMKTY